ncbi:MAG: recombinase family protein [Gemmataceae bacterium]
MGKRVIGSSSVFDQPATELFYSSPGDAVIVPKLDRGFRNMRDILNTLETWERRGISLHLLDVQADTTTEGRCLLSTPSGQWSTVRTS